MPGRVVVIGDVHGDLGRLTLTLQALGVINGNWEWVAEPRDTIVVQMGDQLDSAWRVPESQRTPWEMVADVDVVFFMDKLDAIARCHGGRVLSLIGNHEFMNIVGDFSYVSETSMTKTGGDGGRRAMLSQPMGGALRHVLAKRNIVLQIGELLFVHGGLLPAHLDALGEEDRVGVCELHRINSVFRKFIREQPLDPEEASILNQVIMDMNGIIWSRHYVSHPEQLVRPVILEVLERVGCKAVFVGHNTVDQIVPLVDGRLWLTDAMFSRAYGSDKMQVLNVWRGSSDTEALQANIVTLSHDAKR